MRIIHLVDRFIPDTGYQESYLVREQIQQGHEVFVISATMESSSPRVPPAGERKNVIRLEPAFRLPTKRRHPWLNQLGSTIRALRPEVIHCHELVSLSTLRVLLIAKKQSIPLLVDNHAAFFNVFHVDEPAWFHLVKRCALRLFGWVFRGLYLSSAQALVAIGEPEKDFLAWLFPSVKESMVPIIRLAADPALFKPDPAARQRTRSKFGWGDDTIVLGHAGRIVPDKNIEQLFDILPELEAQCDCSIRVLLIGSVEGAYWDHLSHKLSVRGISQMVTLMGQCPHQELAEVMNAWDIGVWPGAISISALEAMAVGIPIVAQATPYTIACIRTYGAGLLFKEGVEKSMSDLIVELARERSKRTSIGSKGREAILQHLNWRVISMQFLELYARIASKQEHLPAID